MNLPSTSSRELKENWIWVTIFNAKIVHCIKTNDGCRLLQEKDSKILGERTLFKITWDRLKILKLAGKMKAVNKIICKATGQTFYVKDLEVSNSILFHDRKFQRQSDLSMSELSYLDLRKPQRSQLQLLDVIPYSYGGICPRLKGLDLDHIPSAAAISKIPFIQNSHQKRENGITIAIPAAWHQSYSPTFGARQFFSEDVPEYIIDDPKRHLVLCEIIQEKFEGFFKTLNPNLEVFKNEINILFEEFDNKVPELALNADHIRDYVSWNKLIREKLDAAESAIKNRESEVGKIEIYKSKLKTKLVKLQISDEEYDEYFGILEDSSEEHNRQNMKNHLGERNRVLQNVIQEAKRRVLNLRDFKLSKTLMPSRSVIDSIYPEIAIFRDIKIMLQSLLCQREKTFQDLTQIKLIPNNNYEKVNTLLELCSSYRYLYSENRKRGVFRSELKTGISCEPKHSLQRFSYLLVQGSMAKQMDELFNQHIKNLKSAEN